VCCGLTQQTLKGILGVFTQYQEVEQAILYLTDKGIAIESKGQFGGLTYIVSPSWADDKEFKSIK
jgi:hypothetical protein